MTETQELETMAQTLEQSGLYKILRCLQPFEHLGGRVDVPQRVLIVDTETTGLNPHCDEVIEVGALLIEVDRDTGAMGKVLGSYSGLEQPKNPITPENTAVHGITNDMVAGQRFDDQQLARLMQQHNDHAPLVVAHNAAFDKPFMAGRFECMANAHWACSVREIPWGQEGYGSKALGALLQECGAFHNAHRALADCFALAWVLSKPLKGSARLPMQVLFENANESLYQIAALDAPFDKKDALKARGFRWNAAEKVWVFEAIGFAEGKTTIEWLREAVYETTGKIMLGFRTQNGAQRYMGFHGQQQLKAV